MAEDWQRISIIMPVNVTQTVNKVEWDALLVLSGITIDMLLSLVCDASPDYTPGLKREPLDTKEVASARMHTVIGHHTVHHVVHSVHFDRFVLHDMYFSCEAHLANRLFCVSIQLSYNG